MDRLSGKRVHPGIIHRGRCGHRGRRKVLHLLGIEPGIPDVFCKLHHVPDAATRMTGHKIREDVLPLFPAGLQHFKLFSERFKHLARRFSHQLHDIVADVLGRNLEVPGNMVHADFFKECRTVRADEIIPEPGIQSLLS